jgi:EAL domain-containing protein (putative c-di-GMP-specific phosphodiesterase class I)
MYRAKSKGGGHYTIFDDTMHASAMALLQLEADLKHAVENQEWQVYYQPVVTLPDRTIVGVEALVRWLHPQRGIINPVEFIHVAEETGLILPMGEYVLREACKQVKTWRESRHPGLMVSVNLSGRQFQVQQLANTIKQILDETGFTGDGLQLEITESVAMKDLNYSAMTFTDLDRMGIQISLDDFGNGYSSLGYLNRFPIKILKIDRAFIKDIEKKQNNQTITKAIISMSHALGLDVVAEGVETEEQLAFLQTIFCDKVQGFLISRPLPAEQLESLL